MENLRVSLEKKPGALSKRVHVAPLQGARE